MTAETDIAAINDGGKNTAAEVRTALTSVLARADVDLLYSTWAPDLYTGTNQPTYTVDYGYYLKVGPITHYGFSLSLTGTAGAGEININNLPAALQSAVGTTGITENYYGSVSLHDSGVGVSEMRIIPSSTGAPSTKWNFVYINGFARVSFTFASGDDFTGQGFILNSTGAVTIGS